MGKRNDRLAGESMEDVEDNRFELARIFRKTHGVCLISKRATYIGHSI